MHISIEWKPEERLAAIANLTEKLDYAYIARQDKRFMYLTAIIQQLASGSAADLEVNRTHIEKELSAE